MYTYLICTFALIGHIDALPFPVEFGSKPVASKVVVCVDGNRLIRGVAAPAVARTVDVAILPESKARRASSLALALRRIARLAPVAGAEPRFSAQARRPPLVSTIIPRHEMLHAGQREYARGILGAVNGDFWSH